MSPTSVFIEILVTWLRQEIAFIRTRPSANPSILKQSRSSHEHNTHSERSNRTTQRRARQHRFLFPCCYICYTYVLLRVVYTLFGSATTFTVPSIRFRREIHNRSPIHILQINFALLFLSDE